MPTDEEKLIELVTSMLDFSSPKLVRTARGPRQVSEAVIESKDFWRLWKTHKDELKEIGLSVFKDEDSAIFRAKLWQELDEEDLENFKGLNDEDEDELEHLLLDLNSPDRHPSILQPPAGWNSASYLREYQASMVYTMLQAVTKPETKMVLDASETGLGKTWAALEVVKLLGWNFGVVCPANVVTKWTDTSTDRPFELEPEFVLSYDKLRSGKTIYVDRINSKTKKTEKTTFRWDLLSDVVLIFDEVHYCTSSDSLNGQLLKAAIENPYALVYGISATVAEDPISMKTIGFGLGLHSYHDHWTWCLKQGCRPGPFGGLLFNTGKTSKRKPTRQQLIARARLQKLHTEIFPAKGGRLKKTTLGDSIPANQVMAESIDLDLKFPAIQQALKELAEKEEADEQKAEDKGQSLSEFVITTRARQLTELGKLSFFWAKTQELAREGNSVILFLNYTASINVIRQLMVKSDISFTVLVGGLSSAQRNLVLNKFQRNEAQVIICQMDAGAASIDLDDINGTNPRVSLISPCYDGKKILQALGRGHRPATTKSPVMQWVIYAVDGIEERVCRIMQHKLNNMALLNDGNLSELNFGV